MKFTFKQFSVFIHLVIALLFLTTILEPYLPSKVYEFLDKNSNTLFGVYYIYLAYEIYLDIEIGTPILSPFSGKMR